MNGFSLFTALPTFKSGMKPLKHVDAERVLFVKRVGGLDKRR
jgi:hypothetical protein